MSDSLLISHEGAVQLLTINNPQARNALTPEFMEAMPRVLADAEANEAVGAIVLTGAGGAFCAGGDVNRLARLGSTPAHERREQLERLHRLIRAVQQCGKPVIAAVEGAAAGAGFSLAMACDLLVSARNAAFSLAYVKIGLSPDGGATSFLSEYVSRQLLTEMCLTGERVTGERMHALGAVNRLTEPGDAAATAIAVAEAIARGPQRAMARIKSLCRQAAHQTFDAQMDLEAQLMVESQGDEEAVEGIRAFLEKRPADFLGLRQSR
ncbi:enoyl-CoA hydratase/carnithine racemase [Paraburkholderia youngii]|uniref:oxepin-CoA hydrolase, alternative type n=1 Tax=Paraburkholderia youngii TaxID=2782701 RepID=UPI003D2507C2